MVQELNRSSKFVIPNIELKKLNKMYETLKPLVYDKQKEKLRYIELNLEEDQLRVTAFTWNPKFKKGRQAALKSFKSAHFLSSSYHGLWKPSVEEVFAFIQDNTEILKDAVAFSVEAIAIHESGKGIIGLATFYKRERPIK